MKIKTKQECIDELLADPRFKAILSMAPGDGERKMIQETTLKFISSFTDGLSPAIQEIKKNPDGFGKKEVPEIDESLITVDSSKK